MFSLVEACGVLRATALFAGSAGSQAEKLGALTSLGSLGAGTFPHWPEPPTAMKQGRLGGVGTGRTTPHTMKPFFPITHPFIH